MYDLWELNKKFFKRAKPKFPKKWSDDNHLAYIKFRDRRLKYDIPKEVFENLSEQEKVKKFRRQFPGRKVYHYNHRIEGRKVILETTFKILPKGRLSNLRGRIRDEVREALLIKPGPACLLKGVVPFKYGTGPCKVKNQDKRIYHFLNNDGKDLQKYYKPEEHDRISVPGNWSCQWRDIQKCADVSKSSINFSQIRRAIKERFNDNLFLPALDAPDSKDCLMVKTNPKAQVGIISSKLYGRNHAEADKFMRPIAKLIFEATGKSVICDNSLWTVGGRDRRQKVTEDAPLRGRIIMMPDGIPKIIGLTYASRIYDALAEINYGKFNNECQIGRNDFHGNYIKYSRYWRRLKGFYTLEADIKTHDADTSELLLVVAFGLLRACFPDSKEIDNRFLYIMSGTVYKNLLVPGRFIYKLLKSIPSGSPFTSILVTLVNWLNWSTLINNEFKKRSRDFKMNLFGDDTIINLPDDCIKNATWWVQKFKSICGYDLEPCELHSFHHTDWKKRPSFLKSRPIYDLPSRLEEDIITSLSFTRRRNKGTLAYIEQISGSIYNSPFNLLSTNFGFRYRTHMWKFAFSDCLDIQKWKLSKGRRRIEDNFTWKIASGNYLHPKIFPLERIKNVDLGNKPKVVQPGKNVFRVNLSDDFIDMYLQKVS